MKKADRIAQLEWSVYGSGPRGLPRKLNQGILERLDKLEARGEEGEARQSGLDYTVIVDELEDEARQPDKPSPDSVDRSEVVIGLNEADLILIAAGAVVTGQTLKDFMVTASVEEAERLEQPETGPTDYAEIYLNAIAERDEYKLAAKAEAQLADEFKAERDQARAGLRKANVAADILADDLNEARDALAEARAIAAERNQLREGIEGLARSPGCWVRLADLRALLDGGDQ